MTEEELILEGDRYVGRFIIEEHVNQHRELVNSEVGNHWENRVYRHYTGEGIVTDTRKNLSKKFLIYPNGMKETNLIILEKGVREKIKDYKRVIDLSLQKMYEYTENYSKIIPKVIPVCLDEKILSEKGLI